MSITLITAAMLLHEHKYRPITGSVFTIGRHSLEFSNNQADDLLSRYGVPKRAGHAYDVDHDTTGVPDWGHMTQESWFRSFSDADVQTLDVSDYEGARIVHDMQEPLPHELCGVADFIYNGSCFDNIFDPAAALRNCTRMLKPGGRMYHFEQGNSHPTAYLKYSADWFMDFCAINQFRDCKTYIVLFANSLGVPAVGGTEPQRSPSILVYSFNPYVENEGGAGYDCSQIEAFERYEIHCLAEKGDSRPIRNPIQKHYRVDPEHKAICLEGAKRFLTSGRPLFRWDGMDPSIAPCITSSIYPEQIKAVAAFR